MANQLSLEVVTPHRTVLIEDVESVTLPGIEGELGILPEHIPLADHLIPELCPIKTAAERHWPLLFTGAMHRLKETV